MHADNARSSSSSGGSTDIYKVRRKTLKNINSKGSSSEDGSLLRSMDTTPTIDVSASTTPPDEEVDDDEVEYENDMEECYSPQQKAPPLISDRMAKSNYHQLPFNKNRQQQR
jgi:hypothetical protein